MKRILFISINDHVPWGGSEVLWSKVAKNMNGDHKVKVLIKKWDPDPLHICELKKQGISIFYKKTLDNKNKALGKITNIVLNRKQRTPHCLQQEGLYDLDLVIMSVGNHLDERIIYYTKYLSKINIPFIILFQLVTDLKSAPDLTLNKLLIEFLNAKKLCFVSKENREKFKLQLGHDFKNTLLVNNPFNPVQNYIDYEGDRNIFNLAFVAAFNVFHKGHDLLFEVISSKKWKDRPLKINLYGDGYNRILIERLIKMLDLNKTVFLKGFTVNKFEIWKENHGLILPSRMEGQSLAMLEAMSSGRMIICSKVGDADRLIEHDSSGFIIDTSTVSDFDRTLEMAWEKRMSWLDMGIRSKKRLRDLIPEDPVSTFTNVILEEF